MNVIASTLLRNNFSDTLSELKKKDYFLVAKRGQIISALVDIELFEDLMALTNKRYLNEIKKARQEYENGNVFTHKQAFGEI